MNLIQCSCNRESRTALHSNPQQTNAFITFADAGPAFFCLLYCSAFCAGVYPDEFFNDLSAPARMRSFTISASCSFTAMCKGYLYLSMELFFEFTSPLKPRLLRNSLTF